MRRAMLALGLLLAACGEGIGIEPFFVDELVEAPARSLALTVLSGANCDEVLSKTAADVRAQSNVVAKLDLGYPLDPTDSSVFDSLPSDELLTFDAVARDGGGLQIGRSCAAFRIDALEVPPRLELRALPACATAPSRVDVTLVIDTSVRMGLADQEALHIPDFLETALDPVAAIPGTVWSLMTYGHAEVTVEPTTDLESVRSTVRTLEGIANGQPKLFDAVAHASELSRARAVCGTRSALVVLASYQDEGSSRPFDDAVLGIVATRGDLTDDLYLIGVAFSDEGYRDLDGLAPMPTEALITGAGGRPQMVRAFQEVRDKLIELAQP